MIDSHVPTFELPATNGKLIGSRALLGRAYVLYFYPKAAKLFVLDTNVLMHDPTSLFQFEEHDVYVPMATLEELDNHKKGVSEVARNARQASRFLDELISPPKPHRRGHRARFRGSRRQERHRPPVPADRGHQRRAAARLASGKADNQIIAVVKHTCRSACGPRQVILVSKDINMRIKARALGLAAEDYFSDKVLEDSDLLYTGVRAAAGFLGQARQGHGIVAAVGAIPTTACAARWLPGVARQSVRLSRGREAVLRPGEGSDGRTAVLRNAARLHASRTVWGHHRAQPRAELRAERLMNPDIDFVSLVGQAGTGKTLLTLAAGLQQTLEHKTYRKSSSRASRCRSARTSAFCPAPRKKR
jgi:PhoH-like ATPase